MTVADVVKPAGDTLAATTVVGTILQWLPPVAALFAVIWYSIGFYEKVTAKPFSESKLAAWIRRDSR